MINITDNKISSPYKRYRYTIKNNDSIGKVLKKYRTLKTTKEKLSYTILHRFVFNLKRILQKAGLGGRLGTFAVALGLLIREDKNYRPYKNLIESAVITYLKETNQYEQLLTEQGDVMTPEIEQEIFCNCFGIDVYEVEDKLVSEGEMPKHYKQMMDELINKMDEDAPANSVAGGGVDLNPTGARMSPKMMKRKKEQGDEQDKITKKISKMIKANEDNNNVILKQVNESLSKVEDKSDEKLGLKQDVTVEETKEYKTFRDKYNG